MPRSTTYVPIKPVVMPMSTTSSRALCMKAYWRGSVIQCKGSTASYLGGLKDFGVFAAGRGLAAGVTMFVGDNRARAERTRAQSGDHEHLASIGAAEHIRDQHTIRWATGHYGMVDHHQLVAPESG